MQTSKLFQQAGQFIVLGKFGLALEQYVKIHQLDPQDTTIINTIGDLNLRLGKEPEALLWYQKLAKIFESRGLSAQAAATYKKILKLSPQNQAVMTQLAELYEKEGQTANAKAQYTLIAEHFVSSGLYEKAIVFYRRICRLDPACRASWLQLARTLERTDAVEEASQAYLQCVELLVKKGDVSMTDPLLENLFRLKVRNRELAKSFFRVLRQVGLTHRGVEYLQTIALDKDPEIKAMLGEVCLEDGNLEMAANYLISDGRVYPSTYPVCLKLLQALIAKNDVTMSLNVIEALFETSLQLRDEITLKAMLDSLLECDESNLRVLRILMTLVVRMGRGHELEHYAKRLVILQLQSGNLSDARDQLNKIVIYGQSSFYLDLFNRLNEAIAAGSAQGGSEICESMIQCLKTGVLDGPRISETGSALGVSEADLGTGWEMESPDNL